MATPPKVMIPQRRAVGVLIVDDSVVVRRIMSRAFAQDERFSVVGAVANGAQALRVVNEQSIDLVLLDIDMPGLNGLEVLQAILSTSQHTQVVLLSGFCCENGELALQALGLGASDVVAKPAAGHFSKSFMAHLRDRLVHLVAVGHQGGMRELPSQDGVRLLPLGSAVRAVAIGASTGGISATMAVLKGLEHAATFPIFITQHLPANFLPVLAEQLRRATCLPVVMASQGMVVERGTIHLAPGTAHLSLEKDEREQVLIHLSEQSSHHGSYPAVDPMFGAMARIYGRGVCGVILSGMGRDGLVGAQAIVAAQGWVIVQDHRTSSVWGMPGAVVKGGLASAILPPDALAGLIVRQARGPH